MKVIVRTLLNQELEVPTEWTKKDVLMFLAEHQSFRDAFQNTGNNEARITDIEVIEETVQLE